MGVGTGRVKFPTPGGQEEWSGKVIEPPEGKNRFGA